MVLYLHGEQLSFLNNKGDNNMKPLKTIDIKDLADTKYTCEIKFD